MLTNRFHKAIQFPLKAESCIIIQKINPLTLKKANETFKMQEYDLKMRKTN